MIISGCEICGRQNGTSKVIINGGIGDAYATLVYDPIPDISITFINGLLCCDKLDCQKRAKLKIFL